MHIKEFFVLSNKNFVTSKNVSFSKFGLNVKNKEQMKELIDSAEWICHKAMFVFFCKKRSKKTGTY